MKLLRDIWLIFQRQFLLLVRNPIWVFVGVFQPVMYLLLFAPLLKPALGVSTNAEAYRIFVPGLLVLLAIFGGLFQGFGLIAELRAGVIERSRVTPVSRVALLLGPVPARRRVADRAGRHHHGAGTVLRPAGADRRPAAGLPDAGADRAA